MSAPAPWTRTRHEGSRNRGCSSATPPTCAVAARPQRSALPGSNRTPPSGRKQKPPEFAGSSASSKGRRGDAYARSGKPRRRSPRPRLSLPLADEASRRRDVVDCWLSSKAAASVSSNPASTGSSLFVDAEVEPGSDLGPAPVGQTAAAPLSIERLVVGGIRSYRVDAVVSNQPIDCRLGRSDPRPMRVNIGCDAPRAIGGPDERGRPA
jgi:hypothetical protein